jgi:hypothetical protein
MAQRKRARELRDLSQTLKEQNVLARGKAVQILLRNARLRMRAKRLLDPKR